LRYQQHGEIQSQGSYESLLSRGVDFVSMLNTGNEGERDSEDDAADEKESSALSPVAVVSLKSKSSTILPKQEKDSKDRSEGIMKGSVSFRTYLEYFKSGNSTIQFVVIILCFIATQCTLSFTEVWLSKWYISKTRESKCFIYASCGEIHFILFEIIFKDKHDLTTKFIRIA
jgi:hypothetical protein